MTTPYDPSKFTVALENGERMKVSDLNTNQAEQQICRLLTIIRDVQFSQIFALESVSRKLQKAGIEIVK